MASIQSSELSATDPSTKPVRQGRILTLNASVAAPHSVDMSAQGAMSVPKKSEQTSEATAPEQDSTDMIQQACHNENDPRQSIDYKSLTNDSGVLHERNDTDDIRDTHPRQQSRTVDFTADHRYSIGDKLVANNSRVPSEAHVEPRDRTVNFINRPRQSIGNEPVADKSRVPSKLRAEQQDQTVDFRDMPRQSIEDEPLADDSRLPHWTPAEQQASTIDNPSQNLDVGQRGNTPTLRTSGTEQQSQRPPKIGRRRRMLRRSRSMFVRRSLLRLLLGRGYGDEVWEKAQHR